MPSADCHLRIGDDAAPGFQDVRSAFPRGCDVTAKRKLKVVRIEDRELEGHRAEIIADVKKMVEKYRKIFDWDVPDIDQAEADRLILLEMRKALGELDANIRDNRSANIK